MVPTVRLLSRAGAPSLRAACRLAGTRGTSTPTAPVRCKSDVAAIPDGVLKAPPSGSASEGSKAVEVEEQAQKSTTTGPWQRFVAFATGAGVASAYYFYELQQAALAEQELLREEIDTARAQSHKDNRELRERLAILEHKLAQGLSASR